MFAKLWNDEAGVVSVEYLFLTTIVGLGLVIGYTNLEGAIDAEYTELASSIMALSQGWETATQSGCKATVQGSNATDSADLASYGHSTVTPLAADVSAVDVIMCPGT